jgi:hypothetical protein
MTLLALVPLDVLVAANNATDKVDVDVDVVDDDDDDDDDDDEDDAVVVVELLLVWREIGLWGVEALIGSGGGTFRRFGGGPGSEGRLVASLGLVAAGLGNGWLVALVDDLALLVAGLGEGFEALAGSLGEGFAVLSAALGDCLEVLAADFGEGDGLGVSAKLPAGLEMPHMPQVGVELRSVQDGQAHGVTLRCGITTIGGTMGTTAVGSAGVGALISAFTSALISALTSAPGFPGLASEVAESLSLDSSFFSCLTAVFWAPFLGGCEAALLWVGLAALGMLLGTDFGEVLGVTFLGVRLGFGLAGPVFSGLGVFFGVAFAVVLVGGMAAAASWGDLRGSVTVMDLAFGGFGFGGVAFFAALASACCIACNWRIWERDKPDKSIAGSSSLLSPSSSLSSSNTSSPYTASPSSSSNSSPLPLSLSLSLSLTGPPPLPCASSFSLMVISFLFFFFFGLFLLAPSSAFSSSVLVSLSESLAAFASSVCVGATVAAAALASVLSLFLYCRACL